MRLKFLIVVFALVPVFPADGYTQERKYYSKQELSDDIDSLYSSIRDIHPFMFSYVSRYEFEKDIERVKQSLSDSMTMFGFYRKVVPLVTGLGDGHIEIGYPEEELTEYNAGLFPYLIDINKTDTVVSIREDWSGAKRQIPSGAVILSVNGKECGEIIRECLNLLSGELFHFKVRVLNMIFPCLLYPILNDSAYSITYSYQGKIYKKEVQGMDAKQYMERVMSLRIRDYVLSVDEKTSIAVIRFDVFGFDGAYFKRFLDSTFLLLKNKSIENLIIDIRNNGGGSSSRGDDLFQYISPVPFQQFGKTIRKVSDPVAKRYHMAKGLFIEEAPLIPLTDNPLRFNGHVYLLTSNFTFSSAASFANAFQYFGMGKIVGEETGGLVVCFGNVFDCVMPHTSLKFGVSWQKYYLYGNTGETKRGVLPDYPVPADQAMEKTMNLISEQGRE